MMTQKQLVCNYVFDKLVFVILIHHPLNQATGYAIQHIPVPVPSQDKLEGLWQTERTWREVVQKDCQVRNLNREDAMDHGRWKKLMKIG